MQTQTNQKQRQGQRSIADLKQRLKRRQEARKNAELGKQSNSMAEEKEAEPLTNGKPDVEESDQDDQDDQDKPVADRPQVAQKAPMPRRTVGYKRPAGLVPRAARKTIGSKKPIKRPRAVKKTLSTKNADKADENERQAKKRRFTPDTRFRREFVRLLRDRDPVQSFHGCKSSMVGIIRDILADESETVTRITKGAVDALITAVEQFLIKSFNQASGITQAAKRRTFMPEDLRIAVRLANEHLAEHFTTEEEKRACSRQIAIAIGVAASSGSK